MKKRKDNQFKFNVFSFMSTFARSLIEIFISLYLFKSGFPIYSILTFYFLENFLAIFISYFFVYIGEKYHYSIVMYIGIFSFIILQLVLNNIVTTPLYIVLISILYSLYRRGYWVARRYYISNVIPQRNSSESLSIILVSAEIASILSGYVGAILLDNWDMTIVMYISSILLFISVIPLMKIPYQKEKEDIQLWKHLKEYDKRNYLAFTLYEITNLLTFLFPIYIAMYIQNTYSMAGNLNAISNAAIILFIFLYGKIIKKKNYFVLSSILFFLICIMKIFILNYFILLVYFIEGIVKKMQAQSVNKIYFENRNGMDLTHYNLIYQWLESLARSIVVIPLFFMSQIQTMILFVLMIMSIELLIYSRLKKSQKLN